MGSAQGVRALAHLLVSQFRRACVPALHTVGAGVRLVKVSAGTSVVLHAVTRRGGRKMLLLTVSIVSPITGTPFYGCRAADTEGWRYIRSDVSRCIAV